MILEIVKFGDPILRAKGAPVPEITEEIRQLATDMLETMRVAEADLPESFRKLRGYLAALLGTREPAVYVRPELTRSLHIGALAEPVLEKSSGENTVKGNPDCMDQTPLSSQPPKMPFTTPPRFNHLLPFPTDNCQM